MKTFKDLFTNFIFLQVPYIVYFGNQFAYFSMTNSPCILLKTLHPSQDGYQHFSQPSIIPQYSPTLSSFRNFFLTILQTTETLHSLGYFSEWGENKTKTGNWFLLYYLSHFAKHLPLKNIFSHCFMLYYVCHFGFEEIHQNFYLALPYILLLF